MGSNSTRLAGNVIVGVSAAFLVWDAIDLGINIVDLVRRKDFCGFLAKFSSLVLILDSKKRF